jgi:branched-chain amino acid transport system ATP-binding protein
LVDELSLGLAPLIVAHLIQTLMQMKQDLGLTLLMVEQNAAVALRIADYAAVMENGRIVFDGTPQKLMGHQDVREFYLGLHESGEKSYRDIKQYRRSRRWWG